MTETNLAVRTDRDPYAYPDAAHLDEARRAQQANAPAIALVPGRPEKDATAHLADVPSIQLSDATFTNPALVRSATPGVTPADACATAQPTRIVVGPKRRGEEIPTGVDVSCTKKGGFCLTKEEAAQLEGARQAACMATGIDPLRFQAVPPLGPAIDRDRAGEGAEHHAAALRNLELVAHNAFAAAAYSGARVGGVDERTAQNVGQLAGVAGDVVLTAGVVYAGGRAARAPAIAKPDLRPLSQAETATGRQFLAANGTPPHLVDKTLEGFASGVHVETLHEDVHVFRYYGGDANPRGRWVTEQPATRPVAELALDREQNPATTLAEWVIPKGTTVLRGPVGQLNNQPGGSSQIFIPDPRVLREP